MSTRSTTHFQWEGRDFAIVYRHPDGYPDGAGVDILKFSFDEGARESAHVEAGRREYGPLA